MKNKLVTELKGDLVTVLACVGVIAALFALLWAGISFFGNVR